MAVLKTDSMTEGNASAPTGDSNAALAQTVALVQQQCQEILAQVKAMREELSQLSVREGELRAVLERATEMDAHLDRLKKTLRKTTMAQRVTSAIESAEYHREPFPYTVIDNFLPSVFYDALLTGIPPVELFESKPMGKQHLDVPFALAPLYSQRIWRFMANELIPNVITPAIVTKFRAEIDDWIRRNWPDLPPESIELRGSGGRIMYRRRGYRILPHRDPKWSFITCILYLARPGDDETWGTQFYAVENDKEAKSAAPYWIDEKNCRLVEDVRFLPNRLLVFLNSEGAHGAFIPPDAQPEDLQRYIYQFRLGPTLEWIAKLKSMLPEERQALWAGKALVDY
jgi:hypothetical protein